jgi:hypothetical protein
MTTTTTTTWNIAQLERHAADGIIFTAHYTVDANDGTYSAGAYGSVGLEQPDPDEIIPYADTHPRNRHRLGARQAKRRRD